VATLLPFAGVSLLLLPLQPHEVCTRIPVVLLGILYMLIVLCDSSYGVQVRVAPYGSPGGGDLLHQ
jgi:hypothetical protein